MSKGNSAVSLVIACLGGVVIVLGITFLGLDIARSLDAGEWRSDMLLDLLKAPRVESFLPEDFVAWLQHPRSLKVIHPPVVYVLDIIPQWLVCVALGGLIVWKALK
jgi:hypothetical protein